MGVGDTGWYFSYKPIFPTSRKARGLGGIRRVADIDSCPLPWLPRNDLPLTANVTTSIDCSVVGHPLYSHSMTTDQHTMADIKVSACVKTTECEPLDSRDME